MSMTQGLPVSVRGAAVCLLALLVLAGCAAPPPAPLPERPAAPSAELLFDAGVDYAVDDLLTQVRRLPAFNPPPKPDRSAKEGRARRLAVSSPWTRRSTATPGSRRRRRNPSTRRLLQRAADKFTQFDVVPVSSSTIGRAQYLLAGTLTPLDAANPTRGSFRINFSLTDIKTGFIVAQSVARVRGDGVDTTPTPFYRDSPSLTKDRVVEGQIRTAQAATGSSADEVYLSRMPINALVGEASKLYEAGNYAEALRYYDAAAARPEGAQLRVFNGLYLANTQLGRTDDAEKAFAKIVALGLATNSLSVKFLYRPGSLEFLADPKISGPYTMWQRLIAREVAGSGSASRSSVTRAGPERSNSTTDSRCNGRWQCSGASKSWRRRPWGACSRPEWDSGRTSSGPARTIWRDSLDRRVEFKVRAC